MFRKIGMGIIQYGALTDIKVISHSKPEFIQLLTQQPPEINGNLSLVGQLWDDSTQRLLALGRTFFQFQKKANTG